MKYPTIYRVTCKRHRQKALMARYGGAVILEFALILPILLLLLGISIDAMNIGVSLTGVQYGLQKALSNTVIYTEEYSDQNYIFNAASETERILSDLGLWKGVIINEAFINNKGAIGRWLVLNVRKRVNLTPFSRLFLYNDLSTPSASLGGGNQGGINNQGKLDIELSASARLES